MPIELAEYDPGWPRVFERARAELSKALGPKTLLEIEHIGSTAVPKLAAKPIVDLLAGVRSLSEAPAIETRLADLGYSPWHGGPGRRTLERRDHEGRPSHHLHLVVHRSPIWHERLAFRDWLRASPIHRDAYEQLKRELAAIHEDTREYSRGKDGFVRDALAQVRSRS